LFGLQYHFGAGKQANIESAVLINDDFFESGDEVVRYLETDNSLVIEMHNQVVGCGIGKLVVSGRRDVHWTNR